ncbi:hypothetical protein RB600_003681 [Gaeumannomyces tritici]
MSSPPSDSTITLSSLSDSPPRLCSTPPRTTGVYLNGMNDDLESLHCYEEGGFHPVHLDDTLGSACRYEVLHKLGHGGYGTVWLCRDRWAATYVAVKANIAHASKKESPDLKVTQLARKVEVRTKPKKPPEFFPRYLINAANLSRLTSLYTTGKICVIGFGEAYPFDSPPDLLGIPSGYRPHEKLVLADCIEDGPEDEAAILRVPIPFEELICETAEVVDRFPDAAWDQWKGRREWFDDEGNWLGRYGGEAVSLSAYLENAERKWLGALRLLFKSEPQERARAEAVLNELVRILNSHLVGKGMQAVEIGPDSDELSFKRLLD